MSDENGRQLLPPGTGFLSPTSDPTFSYQWPTEATEPWHLLYVQFGGASARDMVAKYNASRGRLVRIPLEHPLIGQLRDWSRYNAKNALVDSMRGMRLLVDLLEACEDDHRRSSTRRLCDAAVNLMQSHIAAPLMIEAIAEKLSISREYLTSVFQDELSTTPGRFYRELRLRRAREALIMSQDTINTIGKAHGFADATHFGKGFRRLFGISPGDWRKSHT